MTASRRLFIYFRVQRESEAAATAIVRELHSAWAGAMSGLQCELLRRADEAGPAVTLMEIYTCSSGIGTDWQRRIESDAAQRLGPWLAGPRHVEVFESCDPKLASLAAPQGGAQSAWERPGAD